MMRAAASLNLTLGLMACAAPAVQGQGGPLRVTNGDMPFAFDQGAAARKVAEATCAARGGKLKTGVYDRFESGAWVYPEGCGAN